MFEGAVVLKEMGLNKIMLEKWFLAALLIVASAGLQAEEASSSWEKIESYGQWAKHCSQPQDAQKQCRIFQSAKQNDQLVFQVSVGYVEGYDSAVVFMTGPLGVFLPKGVSIIAGEGEGEAVTAGFLNCNGQGCHTRFGIDEAMVNKLKAGKMADVIFWASNDQTIKLPMDLQGFTSAMNSLDKP